MADGSIEPPPRRTQAERTEAMRRRLLDAARQVASERGFAGLRMADVAQAAGVSVGAQLHHFPTKNALIVALFEDLYSSMADASRRRQTRPKSLQAAIRGLIDDSHDFFFGESFHVSLDIAIGATRDPSLREDVLAIIARFRTSVEAQWIDRLVAFGIDRERAVDALWLVNSAIRGLTVRAIWDNDAKRFKRLEQLCETLLMDYLKDGAQATERSTPSQ